LNTVSKFDLMAVTNMSVLKGVRTDLLPAMADYAMRLKDMGRASGSVTDIVDTMSTALATQRQITLNQYGIIIDTEEAYKRYATALGKTNEQLTELDKKTAFALEFETKLKEMLEKTAKPTRDVADAFAAISASLKDFRAELGMALGPTADRYVGFIEKMAGGLKDLKPATIESIAKWAVLGTVFSLVGGALLLLATSIGSTVGLLLAMSGALALTFLNAKDLADKTGLTAWLKDKLGPTISSVVGTIRTFVTELGIFKSRTDEVLPAAQEQFKKFGDEFLHNHEKSTKFLLGMRNINTELLEELLPTIDMAKLGLQGMGEEADKASAKFDKLSNSAQNVSKSAGLSNFARAMIAAGRYDPGTPVTKRKFQTGGFVANTGLALVHQGERIVPSSMNKSSNGKGIIINIGQLSGVGLTVDELAMRLQLKLAQMVRF